jgi:branched-chain amino acid transport system substrate-binding protein
MKAVTKVNSLRKKRAEGEQMNDEKCREILSRVNRRDFIVKSLAAGAITLMPRIAGAAPVEPFRIGVLLDTTGAGANYCERSIKGLPLIAGEINKRGGILGEYPIELYFRDTGAKPDVGTREARFLILNEKVKAIIGSYSSAVALAIQEVVHENKILHLNAISNSSTTVYQNYTPYSFLFGPDSQSQSGSVVVAVSKLVKQKGWKTYVTLGQDYEWGRDTQRMFVDELKKRAPEAKLVKEFWSRLGETDFSSYVTAIMSMKPDFMYGAIAGKDNEAFIQQAKASGLFKVVTYPGVFLPLIELMQQRATLPRDILGLARCPFFAHMDNPMMQGYVKLFQAKFGNQDYPDDQACLHYDALNGLNQAATKAKSIEIEAIRKALTGATIETCRGKLTFRACNNQLDAPSYVGRVVDTPQYPFPIFDLKTLLVIPSHETWVPTCELAQKLMKRRA